MYHLPRESGNTIRRLVLSQKADKYTTTVGTTESYACGESVRRIYSFWEYAAVLDESGSSRLYRREWFTIPLVHFSSPLQHPSSSRYIQSLQLFRMLFANSSADKLLIHSRLVIVIPRFLLPYSAKCPSVRRAKCESAPNRPL